MKSLILLGGGGHCLSVLDTIHRINTYDEIIILDRPSQIGKKISCYAISGSDEQLPALYQKGYRDLFITVGSVEDTSLRRRLSVIAGQLGFNLINVIDPSAVASKENLHGKGIYIGKNVVINAGSVVSDMAIINTGSIVEHGNFIGKYTHIAVGTVLCGDVKVDNDCLIGANATVLQGIHIGEKCIIGAGSLILKDVPPFSKVFGKFG